MVLFFVWFVVCSGFDCCWDLAWLFWFNTIMICLCCVLDLFFWFACCLMIVVVTRSGRFG